ncbi:GGDEF domain-containing protein [Sphingomonas sp.]|uniref:putative bifunctional diguanylate cyclase/phosphodiesterase n=1 Tax=Sphingomonas sp. TaxID=28214 RepID=UPI0031D94A08
MIAKGETLASTMERLCLEVEKVAPDVICSVLAVDPTGIIRPLAAPSLPAEYSAALEGLAIGPVAGSCGTAAYLRTDVAVTDIETDRRWALYKHLALPLGLRACWSSPIPDADGVSVGIFAFYYRDRREPTEAEREIVRHCVYLCAIALERHQRVLEHERRAFTDALTHLPNRAAFNAALGELNCDTPGAWALLMLDLDNLKIVNDTFGHQAGDHLLQTVGQRLAAQVAPNSTFRIGGDEFAIIIRQTEALLDLDRTAGEILCALDEVADCAGHIVVPRATIGGAILSAGDRIPDRVRQHADFALYHAKETGRGGFVRYWPGLGTNIMRRRGDIREVDAALREGRIDAFYQPIVELGSREIAGLEALCRMRLGDKIVCAADFHEATKDVHVATALTKRMAELVASDVRTWLEMGIPFKHVSINVSSADMRTGNLGQLLEAAFRKENVSLKHVVLEVTEAVYMGDGDRLIHKAIKALRTKGIQVALDDFGTGFASLTHLLTVPIDIIKIDKSFVDRLLTDGASLAIVEALIQIAGKLSIQLIAEGVENEEQAHRLQSAGCLLGQGYLFSKAVDRFDATALLTGNAGGPVGHRASGSG